MDYTDLYNFQSSNGIIVPTDSEVLENIQEKFKEIFGSDLDVSSTTPVGRLIEAIAVLVKSSLGVTAQSANQFNLNNATGVYLDSLGEMFSVTRRPGTYTRVPVTVWMDNSTDTVPEDALVMNDNGDLFAIDSEISPSSQDSSSGLWIGYGTATAKEIGAIDGTKGVVRKIASPAQGWEKVLNQSSPLATGTLVETDEDFRERIKNSRESGVSFYKHLLSKLNKITEVKSVCILENNNLIDAVKKGVTIQGHSIFVCVDHDTGTDVEDQICTAIAECKPAGVTIENQLDATAAELVTKTVYFDCDTSKISSSVKPSTEVSYYKPEIIYPIVYLKVYQNGYSGKSFESDIKGAISEYVDSLAIGDTLRGIMAANYVMQNVSGVIVMSAGVSLEDTLTDDTSMLDSVDSLGYQKFKPDVDRMSVEIVTSLS